MRVPAAVFIAWIVNSQHKLYCAYGEDDVDIVWDTVNIANLVPTTIHADGSAIYNPHANCASSANEIVAAFSGQVTIFEDEWYTFSTWHTRFYRSTDGGASWSYIQMVGGLGKGENEPFPSYSYWYDGSLCWSLAYNDVDESYYALMYHYYKADYASVEQNRLEVYKSSDGGLTWAYLADLTGWQESGDEWFDFDPHSIRDSNIAVDSDGNIHIVQGRGEIYYWKSTDGSTFSGPTTIYAGAVENPTNSITCIGNTIVVSNDGDTNWLISQNGGTTWQTVNYDTNYSLGNIVHNGTTPYSWLLYNGSPDLETVWSSADIASGTPPTFTRGYNAGFWNWGYARSRNDPLGTEDHIFCGCRKSGNNFIGVLMDEQLPRTTPIWTVDPGVATSSTIAFDCTGYFDYPSGGAYTYFF